MRATFLMSLVASCAVLTGVDASPSGPYKPPQPQPGPTANWPQKVLDYLQKTGMTQQVTGCKTIEVRREWRTFTPTEKANYISAVKCLADKKKNPHSNLLKPEYPRPDIPPVNPDSSLYDDMAYNHMDQTNMIHYTGYFFPFHRWFVHAQERMLKDKCNYKGVIPYWDWSKDAASFNTSQMWDPNPTSGLGGFGDPNNDYTIKDGGFKDMNLTYPAAHKIRRQYTPYPYLTWWWVPRPQEAAAEGLKQSYVDKAINGYVGDFRGMQNATEQAEAFHANIHMIMGGDMAGTCPKVAGSTCKGGSTWTPNDPMFYMHHANMDRIWWKWQMTNPPKNALAFFGGTNMTYSDPAFPNGYAPWAKTSDLLMTDGLHGVIGEAQPTVQDMLLTFIKPAGRPGLCYIYDWPN